MPYRGFLAAYLVLAVAGVWAVTGHAQSAQFGGALAVPLPDGQQEWSLEAAIVSSANEALVTYAGLKPEAQRLFVLQAYLVSKLRRASLYRLIADDPRQALLLSLAPAERQGLPAFVEKLLEVRVHTRGDLVQKVEETVPEIPGAPSEPDQDPYFFGGQNSFNGLILTDGQEPIFPEPTSRTYWRALVGQTWRQASVYGLRLNHQTKLETPLHGIVIDGRMAVSESPLYQYDLWETVQLGFLPGQIVATDGELPIPITDVKQLVDMEQLLIDEVLQFGPRPSPFDPYAWTTGQKDVLVLKVKFFDSDDLPPHSDTEIISAFLGVDIFFRNNSGNLTWFAPYVHPDVLTIDARETYQSAGLDLLEEDALDAAESAGIRTADYDRVVVMAPQLIGESTADAGAFAGGPVVRITGRRAALYVTLTHELGHTFGFVHSAMWLVPPTTADPIGPGEYKEYWDAWDVMGSANPETAFSLYPRHFNAYFKALAGWLPAAAIEDGRTGGEPLNPGTRLFKLYPHDTASPTGVRAIYVQAPDGTTYWLGKRSQFPSNPSMPFGAELRRVQTPTDVHGPLELLDVDPPLGNFVAAHSLRERLLLDDRANGITINGSQVRVDAEGNGFQYIVISVR